MTTQLSLPEQEFLTLERMLLEKKPIGLIAKQLGRSYMETIALCNQVRRTWAEQQPDSATRGAQLQMELEHLRSILFEQLEDPELSAQGKLKVVEAIGRLIGQQASMIPAEAPVADEEKEDRKAYTIQVSDDDMTVMAIAAAKAVSRQRT